MATLLSVFCHECNGISKTLIAFTHDLNCRGDCPLFPCQYSTVLDLNYSIGPPQQETKLVRFELVNPIENDLFARYLRENLGSPYISPETWFPAPRKSQPFA